MLIKTKPTRSSKTTWEHNSTTPSWRTFKIWN